MSLETFSRSLGDKFDRLGTPHAVGIAAVNDFIRALHEGFVKSGRSYAALLAQVDLALGNSAI